MEKIPVQDKTSFLSCKICLLAYDEHDLAPIVLSCGHTICKTCLSIIKNTNSSNSNGLFALLTNTSNCAKCPFCKKELPKNADLILNYEIISLMHFKKYDNSCKVHDTELLNFYCEEDKMLICQYCLLQNHIGHKITKPEDSEIAKYIGLMDEFKQFEKEIREKKFNSNLGMKEIFKKVDDNFMHFTKILNEIKSYIKFEYYQDFQNLKNLAKEVEDADEELSKEYEKLKSEGLSENKSKVECNSTKEESVEGFWKKFSLKFAELKDKVDKANKLNTDITNLQMSQNYSAFTDTLSSLNTLSSKIKDSEAMKILFKPEHQDIENIIEYLMDPRPSTIRYKLMTSTENQNLFSNSSRRAESGSSIDFVLNILKSIDRADFVNSSNVNHAYLDTPMRIGWNTTISAPHMHIITLSYLSKYANKFKPGAVAIDIGSGSGLMALAISKLLGPGSKTIALDHIQEIVDFSRNNINKHHKTYLDANRISFVCTDGRNGFDCYTYEQGHNTVHLSSDLPSPPYQIIHVGAACVNIPEKMIEQLAPGGVMWIPVGPKNQSKKIMLITKEENGEIKKVSLMDVNYAEMQSASEQLGLEEGHSSDDPDM